eukprot:403340064
MTRIQQFNLDYISTNGYTSYVGNVLGIMLPSQFVVIVAYFISRKYIKFAHYVPNLYMILFTLIYAQLIAQYGKYSENTVNQQSEVSFASNHKLRLISFAESYFNQQTLVSFQEYLKAVPEAIIIYEDEKLIYFNEQLKQIIPDIENYQNPITHIEQQLRKVVRPQTNSFVQINKNKMFFEKDLKLDQLRESKISIMEEIQKIWLGQDLNIKKQFQLLNQDMIHKEKEYDENQFYNQARNYFYEINVINMSDYSLKCENENIINNETVDMSQQHSEKQLQISKKKITINGRDRLVITLKDVSHFQLLEDQKKLSFQKSVLMATASHELRNPLNGILGMLQLMENFVATHPGMYKHWQVAYNSSNLLQFLVNDILDYSCTDQNVPDLIIQDQNRFKQILINLISNAIKFTFQGSVEIKAEYFKLRLIEQNEFIPILKVSIKDSGVGMSEYGKNNLFNIFGKLDQHSHINKGGTGLGLFISKQLLQSMGGDIIVHSEEGVGSTFDIYLVNKTIGDVSKSEIIKLEFDSQLNKMRQKSFKIKILEENLYKVQDSMLQMRLNTISLNHETFISINTDSINELKEEISPRTFFNDNERFMNAPNSNKRLLDNKETAFQFDDALSFNLFESVHQFPHNASDSQKALYSKILRQNLAQNEFTSQAFARDNQIIGQSIASIAAVQVQDFNGIFASDAQYDPNSESIQIRNGFRRMTEVKKKNSSKNNIKQLCNCPEVMVCDDQYMNIIALKAMLEHLGIQAEEAQSGQACLDKLAQARPCMCPFYKKLFVDYNMPGISGIDVIQEIKERAKKMDLYAYLKIYVVTGGGLTDREIKQLYEFGITEIILKPISLDKIKQLFNLEYNDEKSL